MNLTKSDMRILIVGMVVLWGMTSCVNQTKETRSGMKFDVLRAGQGDPPTMGQIISFNLYIKDSNDSVWADTYDRGYPEMMEVQDTAQIKNEDGMVQMLRMLSKGDSVRTSITVEDLFTNYAKMPIPPNLDSKMTVNYTVTMMEILSKEEYPAYSDKVYKEYEAKARIKEELHAKEQLPKDIKLIDEHLASKGIQAVALESGIRYVIVRQGEGPKADSGKVASVDYTGYLLNGTYFDTSNKAIAQETGLYNPMREAQAPYAPISVTIDVDSVIKGWHLALKEMNKGMKATFYIPSTLAYGSNRRSEVIGENSILVFDLELVDLK